MLTFACLFSPSGIPYPSKSQRTTSFEYYISLLNSSKCLLKYFIIDLLAYYAVNIIFSIRSKSLSDVITDPPPPLPLL